MPHRLLLLLIALICTHGALAFSPYENYLLTDRETHVGLVAAIPEGRLDAFREMFRESSATPAITRELKKAGIRSAQAFTRNIEGGQYAVIYFAYDGKADYLGAAKAFEDATRSLDWPSVTEPHPRAESYGRHWLQMEWINFIRGLDVDREPTSSLMIGTTVIPEKEAEYRTLHQTTWPGVVDQVKRGNSRNLTIFLVELDDLLVEFLYVEYMGDDQARDQAAERASPVNQRWWKLTDACQRPFPDVGEGIWTLMNPVE